MNIAEVVMALWCAGVHVLVIREHNSIHLQSFDEPVDATSNSFKCSLGKDRSAIRFEL